MHTKRQKTSISRRSYIGTATALACTLAATPESRAQNASGSFMADLSFLNDSLVRISDENVIGIGFIVAMNGNQYIVTNANVVSGHNQLTFTTLSGQAVQPQKIELSATRDLARFMVTDQKALSLKPVTENDPIAVLEYEPSSKIKQYSGSCNGLGKDMIEVTADFTPKSNGSPLLNAELQVCGAANFMTYFKMHRNSWEGTPRRFAYRLDEAHWYAPNWKMYNRTYGKNLREVDEFRTALYTVTNDWMQHPKQEIETQGGLGLEFDRWVKQHNGMVSDLSKKISKNNKGNANDAIVKRFQESCQTLISICESKAKNLTFLCEDKRITPYLKIQFTWRALELKKFCRRIKEHEKAHLRDRWM